MTSMTTQTVHTTKNATSCPTCGAKKGKYCTSSGGYTLYHTVHKARSKKLGAAKARSLKEKVASPQMEMKFAHPAHKRMEDLNFNELVDRAALDIHNGLLGGRYKQMVHMWMDQAIRWSKAQEGK